jgi:hypothetical protein
MQLSDDLIAYYHGVLAVAGIPDPQRRVHFVMPEILRTAAGNRSLTLAAALFVSPRAMRRIRNLVAGHVAYIVPGAPTVFDMYVSASLQVPLLGADVEYARQLQSSRAARRDLLAQAGMSAPEGRHDFFNRDDFVHQLAEFIALKVSHVTQVVFKINGSWPLGGGLASFDLRQLSCYGQLHKTADIYGRSWLKPEEQTRAVETIMLELSSRLDAPGGVRLVNPYHFTTWSAFLAGLLTRGGCFEACLPPETVMVTADLWISPTGDAAVTGFHEHIRAEPFRPIGAIFPAVSVPAAPLRALMAKLGSQLFDRGVVGPASVDVACTPESSAVGSEWSMRPVDLSLGFSTSHAYAAMLLCLCGGEFEATGSEWSIPVPDTSTVVGSGAAGGPGDGRVKRRITGAELTKRRASIAQNHSVRFGVWCHDMFHSNLNLVSYNVFFKMCKAKGLHFDSDAKTGTLFVLLDTVFRARFGVCVVGRSIRDACALGADASDTIRKQLSFASSELTTNMKQIEFVMREAQGRRRYARRKDSLSELMEAAAQSGGSGRGSPVGGGSSSPLVSRGGAHAEGSQSPLVHPKS